MIVIRILLTIWGFVAAAILPVAIIGILESRGIEGAFWVFLIGFPVILGGLRSYTLFVWGHDD